MKAERHPPKAEASPVTLPDTALNQGARHGFVGGASKRISDVVLALLLLAPALPVLVIVYIMVALRDGRPVIYVSERMQTPGRAFPLYKFRTMERGAQGPELGVSGGDKAHRITPLGRTLRRTRLDELPQLFNVLFGHMSFVGPRPPPRLYVERFETVYTEVLQAKPGITGLATVMFHAHEEWLLSGSSTPEETDEIYVRRCIPRKAHLDRIYLKRQSLGLDLYLIYLTAGKLLPLPGARVRRLKNKSKRN